MTAYLFNADLYVTEGKNVAEKKKTCNNDLSCTNPYHFAPVPRNCHCN